MPINIFNKITKLADMSAVSRFVTKDYLDVVQKSVEETVALERNFINENLLKIIKLVFV